MSFIIFTDVDQDDPMVITIEIKSSTIKKVLIDQGSLVNIIYLKTYKKLQLLQEAMVSYDEHIYGFSWENVCTKGYIDLHTIFREGNLTKTIHIWCGVHPSPRNEIPINIQRHHHHT